MPARVKSLNESLLEKGEHSRELGLLSEAESDSLRETQRGPERDTHTVTARWTEKKTLRGH